MWCCHFARVTEVTFKDRQRLSPPVGFSGEPYLAGYSGLRSGAVCLGWASVFPTTTTILMVLPSLPSPFSSRSVP